MGQGIPDDVRGKILIALSEKGVEPACPMCRCPKWVFAGIESAVVLAAGVDPAHEGLTDQVVSLVCANCGFIANYSVKALTGKLPGM